MWYLHGMKVRRTLHLHLHHVFLTLPRAGGRLDSPVSYVIWTLETEHKRTQHLDRGCVCLPNNHFFRWWIANLSSEVTIHILVVLHSKHNCALTSTFISHRQSQLSREFRDAILVRDKPQNEQRTVAIAKLTSHTVHFVSIEYSQREHACLSA